MTKLVSKKVLVPAALAVAVTLVVLAVPPAIAASSGQGMAMSQMPKINGTVNAGQAMKDFLNNNIKVTLSQASDTAAKQVSNGRAVGGHLNVVQGYFVYSIYVIDSSSQQAQMVIVDAGNGQVLYKSDAMPFGSFGGPMFGHGGWHGGGPWKAHGFGGMWHDDNDQPGQ